MITTPGTPEKTEATRRWLQVSLRSFLLVTVVLGAFLGWIGFILPGREEVGAILLIWAIHAVIAGVLSAPIVLFSRTRVHWRPWELLVLILPFMTWSAFMFSELSTGKSLANLGEPFYFAVAVPVAALMRAAIGSRVPERVCAASLIAAMCIVAAGVFFVVPPLPE